MKIGSKMSACSRLKMKKAAAGKWIRNKHPMLGRKHSKQSKLKMSKNISETSRNKFPRILDRWGYYYIYPPGAPIGSRRVREHRWIMEQHLKRKLTKEEQVHHENEIKTDNRLNNLIVFSSNAAHRRWHDNKVVKKSEIIFDGRKLK